MSLAALPGLTRPAEEPLFELERRIEGVEVRRYGPMVVAAVLVDGPAEQAGNQAFPVLAGYFQGRNRGRIKLPMRTPVLQAAAAGGFVVQFILPRSLGLAAAPQATDLRIELREIPPRRIAAIGASGRWAGNHGATCRRRLTETLQAAGLRWVGEPIQARYNAPFTWWILRRHEIWLTLA